MPGYLGELRKDETDVDLDEQHGCEGNRSH
jgi:hypothetical protein